MQGGAFEPERAIMHDRDNAELHPSLRRRAGDVYESVLLAATIAAVWLAIAAAAFAPILRFFPSVASLTPIRIAFRS
jgi:hypothetical protein